MQDRPNAVELIAAVRHFLEHEILPVQDEQRVRFRTLVAANALAIVERELAVGSGPVEHERERLRLLVGSDHGEVPELRKELARRIRKGDADHGAWRHAVFTATLATVQAKLAIANPKFLEEREETYEPRH